MTEKFLTRRAAADYLTEARGLPTSWRTLQKLACVGGGPIYRRYGIHSLYTPADLDAWADTKLSTPRRSTSELPPGKRRKTAKRSAESLATA